MTRLISKAMTLMHLSTTKWASIFFFFILMILFFLVRDVIRMTIEIRKAALLISAASEDKLDKPDQCMQVPEKEVEIFTFPLIF